jgi:hypothetical protein
VVPFATGARAQVRDVRAAAGLGDGQRRDEFAGQDGGKQPRLQRLAAGAGDRRRTDRVAEQARADSADTGARQLLYGDDPHEAIARNPAVLLGEAKRQDADLGRFATICWSTCG